MKSASVGTIIEIAYTLTSPFVPNLKIWEFQREIPTNYSEYRVVIPEYFDFEIIQLGKHPFTIREKTNGSGFISIVVKKRAVGKVNGVTVETKESTSFESVAYFTQKHQWVAKNVPSFKSKLKPSPHQTKLFQIKFELKGTKLPNRSYLEYDGDWKDFNKSFLKSIRPQIY